MKYKAIEFNHKSQNFIITKLKASTIMKIAEIKRKEHNSEDGVQRAKRDKKIKEISLYCQDPDAVFPTPIIIGTTHDIPVINDYVDIDDKLLIGEILDGQHRILGIEKAEMLDDFILPVVIFNKITPENKVFIFTTINSTQTKVSSTEIYNLFGIVTGKSPYKLCHILAEMFLNDSESAFYKKLKTNYKKQYEEESLSLGTFIDELLSLISTEPQKDWINIKNTEALYNSEKLPLRKYFIRYVEEKENTEEELEYSKNVLTLYKILFNYFGAVKAVFPTEWEDSDNFILSKTTGFGALIKLFPHLFKIGQEKKTFTYDFFYEQFSKVKNYMIENKLSLTSKQFPSSGQSQNDLKIIFMKAINLNDI